MDPICLGAKISERGEGCCSVEEVDVCNIPDCVRRVFDDRFIGQNEPGRVVYVSLGLFTIVKLKRTVQLLIPAFDFCIPEKECVASTVDDPCNIFENIAFPVDEFFPPRQGSFDEHELDCGCEK